MEAVLAGPLFYSGTAATAVAETKTDTETDEDGSEEVRGNQEVRGKEARDGEADRVKKDDVVVLRGV
jgi:hypothetical protein